jgi:hypothetical protein
VTSESDIDSGTARIAQIASEPTAEYYKLLSLSFTGPAAE